MNLEGTRNTIDDGGRDGIGRPSEGDSTETGDASMLINNMLSGAIDGKNKPEETELCEVYPFDPDALAGEFLQDIHSMEIGHGPLNTDRELVGFRESRFKRFFSPRKHPDSPFRWDKDLHQGALHSLSHVFPKVSENSLRLRSKDFTSEAIKQELGDELYKDLGRLLKDGREERRRMACDSIITHRDEKANPYTFMGVPSYGNTATGFDMGTILKCPASLNLNEAKLRQMFGNDVNGWAKKCLSFQLMSAVTTGDVLKDTRTGEDKVSVKNPSNKANISMRYQAAYIMAQLSAYLATLIHKETGMSPAVYSFEKYFEGKKDLSDKKKKNIVKQYIYSMLILLVSDPTKLVKQGECCEIAQEEFITADLLALAKEYGIVRNDFGFDPKESYRRELAGSGIGTKLQVPWQQVFDDLFLIRQTQYYRRVHLFPRSKHKEKRPSLTDQISDLVKEKTSRGETEKGGGVKITVASLGQGNALLERWLISKGIISELTCVDVANMEGQGDRIDSAPARTKGGKSVKKTFVVVDTAGIDKNTVEGQKILEDKVFDHFHKGMDLVMAFDALHETPSAKRYLRKLYDLLRNGGKIYIIDPTRSDALDIDRITEQFLHAYDFSEHPHSMTSIEDFFEIVGLLGLRGAITEHADVTPPIYAGYNDSLSRGIFALKKPADDNSILHSLPKEDVKWDDEIREDNDIFSVWPLSLVPENAREKILDTIKTKISEGKSLNIQIKNKHEIKHMMLKWLIPEHEGNGDALKQTVADNSPYSPAVVKAYENHLGADTDFREFNYLAGEARALIKYLSILIGAEIVNKVRESSKGWANFRTSGETA